MSAAPVAIEPVGGLRAARLPQWLLPADWPRLAGRPALADVHWAHGRITAVRPHVPQPSAVGWLDAHGAPVLPGLVDAHTHLDKTFTLARLREVQPGLLGAIAAMMVDRQGWTADDVRARAHRALQWAWEAGTVHLRTHCDWWEPTVPTAWPVLHELAQQWSDRLRVERVALVPLHLYADAAQARQIARSVAASGPGALLGGFVHTSNWDPQALRHLVQAAQEFGLDLDLHVDEELDPAAQGLATLTTLLGALGYDGHVSCGHVCALAAQEPTQALRTLDAVARQSITLVSLPATNLLLQDAQTGRTPRLRGITLVKEAQARSIPLLFASDNVQDPFCPMGSYDPMEALSTATLLAQLPQVFDVWSAAVCRGDWLARSAGVPTLVGAPAQLLVFDQSEVASFPARHHPRRLLRAHAQPARMACTDAGHVPASSASVDVGSLR